MPALLTTPQYQKTADYSDWFVNSSIDNSRAAQFNTAVNQNQLGQMTAATTTAQNQADLVGAQATKATDVNNLLFGKGGDPTGQFSKILQLLGIGGAGGAGGSSASASGGGGANPADYAALLGNVDNLIGQTGSARANDINRGVNDSTNTSLARLQDRGLASSSLSANTAQGGERVRQDSLNTLMDQLLGQRSNAMQSIGLAGLNAQNQNFQFNSQMQNTQRQQGLGFISQLLG